MHIEVGDILRQELGYFTQVPLRDETPQLADLVVVGPVAGEAQLTNIAAGLLASGLAEVRLELECHRCLRIFKWRQTVGFSGEFALDPAGEQWPIEPAGKINLEPLVRQETIISLPIKQLCHPDCPGLCPVCGEPLDAPKHPRHEKG